MKITITPPHCVVVDNPPFSIFRKIVRWYNEHGIDFFLFAPSLTSIIEGATYVSIDCTITYENGARVSTSFVTNIMGELLCVTAPDLCERIREANGNTKNKRRNSYSYPKNLLRASYLMAMAKRGIQFSVSANEGSIISRATTKKSGEYGNSIILCEKKRKELEQLYAVPIKSDSIEFELSEKAKAELERLNALDRTNNPQYYD